MMLAPYLFKARAVRALKGNWQTALLITFFSGIFSTLLDLGRTLIFPNVVSVESAMRALEQTAQSDWLLLSLLSLLATLLTPMLSVSCCHYFVCRLRGEELGFAGLWSRGKLLFRSLWLYLLMGIKVFLWSLLLVVPGVIAAFRYAMAPYYLAEDPTLTAWQAIEKSKKSMDGVKMSLFMLEISFFGWLLLSTAVELLLYDVSPVVAMVVGQCVSLFVATYLNGASAAFYLAASSPKGMQAEAFGALKGDRVVDEYLRHMPRTEPQETEKDPEQPKPESGQNGQPEEKDEESERGQDDPE